jgi:hypothetical protein
MCVCVCVCMENEKKERAVEYWLRHYATSKNVVSSRPDEVFFYKLSNISSRTRPWGSLSL